MSDVSKMLFVCVHNTARSRIAETYLRKLGGAEFDVASAGFEPRESNPLVVEAMQSVGVPLLAIGRQPSVFELYLNDPTTLQAVKTCAGTVKA